MSQNPNTQHDLKQAIADGRSKKWGNLPTMDEFDQAHIEGLIEEQADIAKDLGMYKRMLENPELRVDNRVLVQDLQKLDEQRYWLLDNEIEGLCNDQERFK